jgi:hypothetical protein
LAAPLHTHAQAGPVCPLPRFLPGQSFLNDEVFAGNWGEIGAEKLRLLGILKRSLQSGGISPCAKFWRAHEKAALGGSFTLKISL